MQTAEIVMLLTHRYNKTLPEAANGQAAKLRVDLAMCLQKELHEFDHPPNPFGFHGPRLEAIRKRTVASFGNGQVGQVRCVA